MTAALAGALLGVAIPLSMSTAGLLRDRAGLALLVIAIAVFYPVFAVDQGGLLLHVLIFAAFLAAAIRAFHRSTALLALVLAAHGALDLVLAVTHHPGPSWWPGFCGALDLTAALTIFVLLRLQRIPS